MRRLNCFFKHYIFHKDFAIYCMIFMLCAYSSDSWAAGVTFKSFADTLRSTFETTKGLMTMAAHTCGIGFSIMGLSKFKAYKDNPAQIPVSTPIVLMVVASALLFLPTVFDIAGDAVFGPDAKSGLTPFAHY